MVLDKGILLRYYKRKDIQEAMVEHARDREVGARYGEGGEYFGKRPDILNYPNEVIEMVKNGALSFHCSEERWENPLQLSSSIGRKEMEELRTGWDLLLDIDCKIFEYSQICAELIVRFLRYCGVQDVFVKFSGGKGFHIGVPFEAFPSRIKDVEVRLLFPEAPKKIAFYVKENIKEELGRRIMELEKGNIGAVKEKTGLGLEIVRFEKNEFGDAVGKLNVDPFLEIDTILIAPRHLYRMPYSMHDSSGLVSVVIDADKVMEFTKDDAKPEKVLVNSVKFMDRSVAESGGRLLLQALDFEAKEVKEEAAGEFKGEEIKIESPITEEFFPPCVLKILEGVEDGKKRAVFILMNFLGKIGWEKKAITDYILKWNREKNKEGLRENYITSQLRYFKAGYKLPPNCDNEAYYKDIGVCSPDRLCGKVKNPVNYTIIKWKMNLRDREENKRKSGKEEEKENEVEKEGKVPVKDNSSTE